MSKRFKIVHLRDNNVCDIQDTQQGLPTFYNDLTYNFGSANAICDLLNELYEENERLKEYNNKLMKQPLLFDVQTIPNTMEIIEANNKLEKENEQLKKDLKRCREWINSDKYDYETTLAFIKSKGYSLKDVLEYKGDVE